MPDYRYSRHRPLGIPRGAFYTLNVPIIFFRMPPLTPRPYSIRNDRYTDIHAPGMIPQSRNTERFRRCARYRFDRKEDYIHKSHNTVFNTTLYGIGQLSTIFIYLRIYLRYI